MAKIAPIKNPSPDEIIYKEILDDNALGAMDNGDSDDTEPVMDETDDQIIEKFAEDKTRMDDHWDPIYALSEKDWDLYLLDQWTEDGKRRRKGRPKVTVDICRKFVKSVVAETFQNPPGIKLSARRDGASAKAQAMADAIRYFEDRTGSIYAYSFAKECAAVGGIGWLKVTYRYDEQQAMPAVIDIDRIDDPFSIKIDPDARELDGSDSMCAYESHGKKDKCEQYTYWWKDDYGKVKWALISDGKTVKDKGEWPGNDIPLIPVYGEVYRVRNKVKIFGLIRQLTDTQHTFNYTLSEGIERLALTPKAPIQAAEGSISDEKVPDWQRSMVEPVPILWFKASDSLGNPLPQPSRSVTTPDTDWLTPMIQLLHQNAKETTGIFDTSFGAGPAEMSGTAISQKINAGDRGHLVYDEHLQVSIKHVGRVVLDLLEPVITPSGLMPLLSEDGKVTTQSVGQQDPNQMMMGQQLDQNGMPIQQQPQQQQIENLDPSDLDISISSAPAYATRKEEGIKQVMGMIDRLPPEMASALIPKVIRDMDFPGSSEYADILNPQGGANGQPNAAAQQQQMQQMQTEMQNLQQQNQQLTAQNQQLQAGQEVEMAKLQSQSQIAAQHEQAETERLQMKIAADSQNKSQHLSLDESKAIVKAALDHQKIDNKAVHDQTEAQLKAQKHVDEVNQHHAQNTLQVMQMTTGVKSQQMQQVHDQGITQQSQAHEINLKGMESAIPSNPDQLGQ